MTSGERSTEDGVPRALSFSVDTHLLRELGMLLVGRDSTAVVELLKNSYDADATSVTLHAEDLNGKGRISVVDNGNGMTYVDFETKFLRIAGRSKESGTRQSPRFTRRFTGAKGIGRLSSHKLGRTLSVESRPDLALSDRDADDKGVSAFIDWDAIDKSDDDISATHEIKAVPIPAADGPTAGGTSLTISDLHSGWSAQQLNRFLSEVRSTRPDASLVAGVDTRLFPGEHLLQDIAIADSDSSDPGFHVELSGDFAGTEPQWPTLLAHVSWMIEVSAVDGEDVLVQVSPSAALLQKRPDVDSRRFSFPSSSGRPSFAARIFVRDKDSEDRLNTLVRRFANEVSGIRLFSEGFRVLPYGTPRNDWLGVDADYAVRRSLQLEDVELHVDGADERTYLLPNNNYIGGVFLLDASSHGLQMVVNREGFVPNSNFDWLVESVRRAIQVSVRMRAALGARRRDEDLKAKDLRRAEAAESLLQDSAPSASASSEKSPKPTLDTWIDAGTKAAASLRAQPIPANSSLERDVRIVAAAMERIASAAEIARDEQTQLRVLASLGTQMGAFVHEINGVLGQARIVREQLARLLEADQSGRSRVRDALRSQDELVLSLERLAVYLSDSLDAESRRRRSRQSLLERTATSFRLVAPAAQNRGVELEQNVPPALRTIPMFAAEVNIILTNLLTNAVKAASDDAPTGRRVLVSAEMTAGVLTIRVSNTGRGVDLSEAERWFRPFETTTSETDAVLGQGLGLGLTLTRRIVEDYGGSVRFVEPEAPYATAIEVALPAR